MSKQSPNTNPSKKLEQSLEDIKFILSNEDFTRRLLKGKDIKAVGTFALSHPQRTKRLYDLTKSDILTNPEFHDALLKGDVLWDFIHKTASEGKLDQLFNLFRKFEIEPNLFSDGKILDSNGAKHLTTMFSSKENIQKVKKLVLEMRSENPDWLGFASGMLELIGQNSSLALVKDKKEAIFEYIKTLPKETLEELKKYHIEMDMLQDLSIFTQHADKFKQIIDKLNSPITSPVDGMPKPLTEENAAIAKKAEQEHYLDVAKGVIKTLQTPELHNFIKQNPQFIINNIIDHAANERDIATTLANYNLKKDDLQSILGIIPQIMQKGEFLDKVLDSFVKNNFTQMTKILLNEAKTDPEIKKYLEDNQLLFSSIITKVLDDNGVKIPEGKNIASIIPTLIDHSDELTGLIEGYESGSKEKIISNLIKINANPKIKEFFGDNISAVALGTGIKISKDTEKFLVKLQGSIKLEFVKDLENILHSYSKGDSLGAVKGILELALKDDDLKKLLQDKEAVNKVLEDIIRATPSLQAALNDRPLDLIVDAALENKDAIKGAISSLHNASYGQLAIHAISSPKMIWQALGLKDLALQSPEQRRANEQKSNTIKQEIVNSILEAVNKYSIYERTSEEKFTPTIPDEFLLNKKNSEKYMEVMHRAGENHSLFNGIKIHGTIENPMRFDKFHFDNMRFVNTTLKNVSFKDSKLTNVAFNGAELENIDFDGATIDGPTLKSMVPLSNHKSISWKGAKIVGDISGIDLSGQDLSGLDLSKVTAAKNVNFANTNLLDSILPDDRSVLNYGFNIDRAIMSFEDEYREGIDLAKYTQDKAAKAQDQYFAQFIVNAIEERARMLGEPMLNKDQKDNIAKLLTSNDGVAKYLSDCLKESPQDIMANTFPANEQEIQNNNTLRVITNLYNERHKDIKEIRKNLIKNMADYDIKTQLNVREFIKKTIEEEIGHDTTKQITKAVIAIREFLLSGSQSTAPPPQTTKTTGRTIRTIP